MSPAGGLLPAAEFGRLTLNKGIMQHNTSLTPLKDIISLLREGGLPFNLDDGKIWKVWERLVGNHISRHARPVWIKNRSLMVYVSSPIWIQELRYKEKEIKTQLNDILGRNAIKEIKFKVG